MAVLVDEDLGGASKKQEVKVAEAEEREGEDGWKFDFTLSGDTDLDNKETVGRLQLSKFLLCEVPLVEW